MWVPSLSLYFTFWYRVWTDSIEIIFDKILSGSKYFFDKAWGGRRVIVGQDI